MSREDHPVWSVYDKLRSACLNVKYYSRRLQSLERWNFGLEFLLGATAPSSAIAALWFWNTGYGQIAWRYLAIVAAIAAVAKPLLNLTKRIKEYESILSGYRTLEYDLREISTLNKRKNTITLCKPNLRRPSNERRPLSQKIQKPENAHGSNANAYGRYGYSFHPPAFLYLTRKQTMTDGTEPKPKPQPPSHPHPTPRREPIQPSHFPPSPAPSREHPSPEYLPEHVEPDEPWPRK